MPPGQPSVHRLAALKVQGEKNEAASLTCYPGGRCGPLWLGWWLSVWSEVSGAALLAGKGTGPGPYRESQGLLRGGPNSLAPATGFALLSFSLGTRCPLSEFTKLTL